MDADLHGGLRHAATLRRFGDRKTLELDVDDRQAEAVGEGREKLQEIAARLGRHGFGIGKGFRPVVIIESPYAAWAYGAIAPDSAAGRLLLSGWESVPALLRLARSVDADLTRRAWSLAILHGISGAFVLRDGNATGDGVRYSNQEGRKFRVGGTGSERIDAASQARLASRWSKIASGVEFRETP